MLNRHGNKGHKFVPEGHHLDRVERSPFRQLLDDEPRTVKDDRVVWAIAETEEYR